MTSEPYIVGNAPKHVVAGVDVQNRAKLVLQIVPAARLEADSIDVEPGTPKRSEEEVHVPADQATGVVPEGKVNIGLNIEVNHSKDATRCQERRQRVDDGVVVGLDDGQFTIS